ncbi:MAG TPA: sensor histidine kinase [Streptosporangiaceae bacterium]|jgi:two-component system sensor histidine kinase DesK
MERLFAFGDDETGFGTPRRRRSIGLAIGLLYLIPLAKVVANYSGTKLVLAAVGLVALATTYLGASLSRRNWNEPAPWYMWVWLAAFSALVVVLPPAFGQEWIGLPVYIGIVYAITLPYRWAFWGILGGATLAGVQALLIGTSAGAAASIMITTFAIGLMMVAFRRSRMLVQQLQAARGEVARLAATEERLRIARDLHDLLGHSLSLIVLKSELAGRLADRDAAKVGQEVRDIESVARQALADVREAVSGYRQRTLTDELDSARAVLGTAGVDVTVRTSGTPLPDQLDGLFGWAVREAVTNVVRHARAGRCEIMVTYDKKRATLLVQDNGAGAQSYAPGNGLSGLTERIEGAGGTVEAGPVRGGGFRLAVELPRAPSEAPITDPA